MGVPPAPQSSWWPPRGQVADGAVAGVLLVLAVAETAGSDHLDVTAASLITVTAATLACAWRRRTPLATVLVVYSALVVADLLGSPIEDLATLTPVLFIPVYSVALYGTAWRRFAGIGIALTGVAISVAAADQGADELLYAGPLVTGAWIAGWLVRLRLGEVAALTEDAARLDHERERAVRDAAVSERTRIARELHDVLAHSVSVMVVQAAAADRLVECDVVRAREALGAVQTEGRRALADLARLLGVLRDEHSEIGLAPQPAASDIPELVAHAAHAGLPVALHIKGDSRSLPPGLGLTVFRIVQEALTNVRRHAGDVPTTVRLCYEKPHLTVEVSNAPGDGTVDGRAAPATGGGRGLVGMRERAVLCGGTLDAAPRPDGGYTVTARLPFDHEP